MTSNIKFLRNQELILSDGNWTAFEKSPAVQSPSLAAQKLLTIREVNGQSQVRRKAPWIVGRVQLAGRVVEVPSPVPSGVLVPLLLYADGLDLGSLSALAPSAPDSQGDDLSMALAKNLLNEIRRKIGGDAARQYVENAERMQQIRGRPIWTSMLGAHPSRGLVCRTFDMSTNTPMNRLLGVAIIRATALVKSDPEFYKIGLQLSQSWSNLALAQRANFHEFNNVLNNLSRSNERYRLPLQLARSLLLKIQSEPFQGGSEVAPSIVINLADLLERVVFRLVRDAVSGIPNISVVPQNVDETAFFDGMLNEYRSVRPDLILYEDGIPLAVFDSKFKPQYLSYQKSSQKNYKVTSSDLFQIAFYQSQMQIKFNLNSPPAAFLVAPQLYENIVIPRELRTIYWGKLGSGVGAQVLPLPLHSIVSAIRSGASKSTLIAAAPELASALGKVVGSTRLHKLNTDVAPKKWSS